MATNFKTEFKEKLRGLPRGAVIAFGVRAARIAQPHLSRGLPRKEIEVVGWAIQEAEDAAARGRLSGGPRDIQAVQAYAAQAADVATEFESSAAARAAFYVARAAAAAAATGAMARLTKHFGYGSADNYDEDARDFVAAAAERAIAASSPNGIEGTRQMLLRAIELLRASAQAEAWTDDTPVSPQFFTRA